MSLDERTTHFRAVDPPTHDPFLYDGEDLAALASEAVLADGLADHKANRVTRLEKHGECLWAEVEDAGTAERTTVRLSHDSDGNLVHDCGCGARAVCRHAVAALNRHAAEQGAAVMKAVSARDVALAERLQRARSEVRVEHLDGLPWFGTWKASSIRGVTHFPRSYRVNIRTLHERGNYCTCPDFAVNQLGTCKHIEAVLHQIHKDPRCADVKGQPVPHSYVFLDWECERPPQIRLRRGASLTAELAGELSRFFDAGGLFKGRLPEDFFALCDGLGQREDLIIGEDAAGYAQRLANDTARLSRAEAIRREILATGGILPGVRARLYPYQSEGVAFLAGNGRAMLADDMGLGKTLQAIAAAMWLKQHEAVGAVLVVCPASLKHQWAREIERFTGLEAQIVSGPANARGVQYRRRAGFHIVNYELALRDLSVINSVLAPDLLILDEAQRIKNWRTKTAAAIKNIRSHYAFVLSGTPLENRLEDLYSLMQVVDNQVLGPLWRYQIDFHVTDDKGKVIGYRNLAQLRQRIAPVMLRRDRRLVADQLPERIEVRLDVPMTREQQEHHDSALANAQRLAEMSRRRPLTPAEENRLMAALQQARMACNAAGLVDGETVGAPKLDELTDLLQLHCVEAGHKVVVFSQWERMTRMAEQCARRLGLGTVRLHGGVPTDRRGELLERFARDDTIQVFISTDAGGTGLNLQSASVLINLDVPWNPAVLDQRIARVHRLGQRRSVLVIKLVAADSYETRVMQLVDGKRALFENVVDQEAVADVVGVSRKALESIAADLLGEAGAESSAPAPGTGSAAGAEAVEPAESAGQPEAGAPGQPAAATTGPVIDPAVQAKIVALQARFGNRLERVLGVGGGLLAVLARSEANDDQVAETLSDPDLPVAVIDVRALRSLGRLGAASPLAGAFQLYTAGDTPAAQTHPLLVRARQKFVAAESLVGTGQAAVAVELAAAAMGAAAAARGNLEQVPEGSELIVWLYDKAVPGGLVSDAEASALLRGGGLAQAAAVPDALALQVLDDARRILARTEAWFPESGPRQGVH